jgi:hypothetical protein
MPDLTRFPLEKPLFFITFAHLKNMPKSASRLFISATDMVGNLIQQVGHF